VAHVRQQIREAIAARLVAVPAPVYVSHLYPLDVLPAVVVHTPEEELGEEPRRMGVCRQRPRLLSVEIALRAQAAEDLDATLDDLAVAVEAALAGDETLDGLCDALSYQGMRMESSTQVQPPVGLMRLAYLVEYQLDSGAPDQPVA
jgi:hypothetical protein